MCFCVSCLHVCHCSLWCIQCNDMYIKSHVSQRWNHNSFEHVRWQSHYKTKTNHSHQQTHQHPSLLTVPYMHSGLPTSISGLRREFNVNHYQATVNAGWYFSINVTSLWQKMLSIMVSYDIFYLMATSFTLLVVRIIPFAKLYQTVQCMIYI